MSRPVKEREKSERGTIESCLARCKRAPQRECDGELGTRGSGGFTLLELVAVSVLLAIITVAVTFSLQRPLREARLGRVLDRLEDLDRQARAEARRLQRPAELRIDTAEGKIWRTSATGGSSFGARRQVALGGGHRIDRLLAPGQRSSRDTLRVMISPLGQSDTYALRLHAGRGKRTWLVVVGTTGQCLRTSEDAAVERLLSMRN